MSSKRKNDHLSKSELSGSRKKSKNKQDDVLPEEFKVLQAYRDLEKQILDSRVQVARSADIDVAIQNLGGLDELFSKIAGSRSNRIFAYDAKAIAGISELVQMTVRNLKFDGAASLFNIDDMLNSCKKYMLEEYFSINQISEQAFDQDVTTNANAEIETPGDAIQIGNRIQQSAKKRHYLQQFAGYKEFNQFNWFKMGALYDKLSNSVSTVDHMLGPLSLERKTRAPVVRKAVDSIAEQTNAKKVNPKELNKKQDLTTPEYVKRCRDKLVKKNGKEKISLFKFVLDPNSFSKSVENLFYTSFLIHEGKIVMEEDEEGLPCVRIKESVPAASRFKSVESQKRHEVPRNHIIFQMDMPTWRKLIEKYNITESFL